MRAKRHTDLVMEDVGGVVTRVGDETVGEMWSLFDGQDVLNEVDPQFSKNIETHIKRVLHEDRFMFQPIPTQKATARKLRRIRIQT